MRRQRTEIVGELIMTCHLARAHRAGGRRRRRIGESKLKRRNAQMLELGKLEIRVAVDDDVDTTQDLELRHVGGEDRRPKVVNLDRAGDLLFRFTRVDRPRHGAGSGLHLEGRDLDLPTLVDHHIHRCIRGQVDIAERVECGRDVGETGRSEPGQLEVGLQTLIGARVGCRDRQRSLGAGQLHRQSQ